MIKIAILGLVGAVIGYITNVLAIKLLFRPIKPTSVFKIQGLIPKRHAEIAKSIGEIVETELLSVDEILDKLIEDTDKEELLNSIKLKILEVIKMKFKMFAMFGSVIESTLDDIFESEGERILDEMTETVMHKVTSSISIRTMVEEKIMELDLIKLEEIIIQISKKELKHIEYLGGVLGFLIGLIQGIIVHFVF